MILGIDEAGKGPVIGSMFVAGICANLDDVLFLKKLNINDSKKLSYKKRVYFYEKIVNHISSYYVMEIPAFIIDELRKVMTMNDIMVYCFSNVIKNLNNFNPEVIIIDAADVSEKRFKLNITQFLKKKGLNFSEKLIISKHKADSKYLIVSAASIIAKVNRDYMIEKLNNDYHLDFGSGYPSDPKTINFLTNYNKLSIKVDFEKYIRKSWKTFQNIKK